jgi:hypothetical protein
MINSDLDRNEIVEVVRILEATYVREHVATNKAGSKLGSKTGNYVGCDGSRPLCAAPGEDIP